MADKNHKNVEVSKLKVTVSGDTTTAYASWEPPTGNVSRVFRKKGVSPKTYTVKKKSRTEKYEVHWRYFQLDKDGAKRYVTTSKTTQEQKNATLNIPDGATGIWCYVKPISGEFIDYVPKKDSKGKVQKGKYDEKKHKWYTGKEIHQDEAANTGAIHAPKRPDAPPGVGGRRRHDPHREVQVERPIHRRVLSPPVLGGRQQDDSVAQRR